MRDWSTSLATWRRRPLKLGGLLLLCLVWTVQCSLGTPPNSDEGLVILEGNNQRESSPLTEPSAERPSPPTPEQPTPADASEATLPSEPVLPPDTSPNDSQPVDTSLPTDDSPAPDASFEPVVPDRATPPESTKDAAPPKDTGNPVGTPCSVQGVAGTCLNVADCTGNRQATPGFCPGPKEVQCCTTKAPPTSTCDPNAQPQPNTGLTEAPGTGGCPAGMVRVTTFCIDKYEASLLEVLANGQTQPWSPYFNPGTRKVRAVSLKGAVPQGYISGDQASKACKEAGKRLCTDQEWLRACQGSNNTTYPYGATRQPGVCNDARSVHPAVEYFQSSESWVFSKIQHQCLNQLPQSLARTGSYTGCVTTEGVLDMMGNLHEWTADPTGTFRGGFYVDTYRNGPGCLYRTTAHNTGHWDYSTGFRCCATP